MASLAARANKLEAKEAALPKRLPPPAPSEGSDSGLPETGKAPKNRETARANSIAEAPSRTSAAEASQTRQTEMGGEAITAR